MKTRTYFYISGFLGNFYFERGIWILYLTDLGFSLYEVGILQAVLSVTMMLFEIPSGIISDYLRRKRTLIIGHVIVILYMFMFVLSAEFWMLFIGHIIYGIGLSLISGTEESYLYETYEEENNTGSYGKGIGIYSACVTAALAISLGLGGYIQLISWSAIFYFGILMHFIALIFIFLLNDYRQQGDLQRNSIFTVLKESKKVLKDNPPILLLIMSLAIFSSIVSVYYMYGQTLIHNIKVDIQTIGLIFAFISLLQVFISIKSNSIAEKYGIKKTVLSTIFVILCLFVVSLFSVSSIILISFILINALYSLFENNTSVILNNEIKSNVRATILSIVNLISALIMAIVFPLIGYLENLIDLKIILITVGSISMVICILCLTFYFRENTSSITRTFVVPNKE